MQKLLTFLFLAIFIQFGSHASHLRGGSITYECVGGNYVFQLIAYRDCNGAELSNISQQLSLWNHPTLSSITLNFVERVDISPMGTEVPGGPSCFDCGIGAEGGNGLGAIEKVVYRSAPTNISGVPPADGWIFTYDNFSRNPTITNLQNPESYGLTLVAKIFNVNATNNTCVDNSPQFLQEPHFVSCAGRPFSMNLNTVDADLDSIAISFDQPLNDLGTGTYSPPTNPINVPFQVGFSVNSPTPNSTANPGNITAQVDPSSGEITFVSFTSGSFVIKLKARSYRNGQLISEVEHEMQIEVTNCLGANNPPTITPPFAGLFETTISAGDAINFTLNSSDIELLQDGSPQQNFINPTGLLFGTNSTSTTGCIIEPCATVSSVPPISGIQGATVDFNWQTTCDHVVNSLGVALDTVSYHFVFRVQDNFCPVPQVIYSTVTINVVNENIIQAPAIDCIQGNEAGDFILNWQPVANPAGSFVEYQIHSVQNGLLGTIPAIGTNTFTHFGVTQETDYFIAVVSGCGGNTIRYSDTVSGIFLTVDDLNPGIAVLNWNKPLSTPTPSMNGYYHIYREYPAGTWNIIDSVPYGTTNYQEIIDICDIALNYQIVLPNTPCAYSSQIAGGNFDDQTPPDIPIVAFASIDTLTGETIIQWNQNDQPDTYGYLIYVVDPLTGFLIELDTIYGITSTTYSYLENYTDGPLTYTVAAFDSCPSISGAPFNLSARDPNFHTTIFLSSETSICNSSAILSWSNYIGWLDNTIQFELYVKPENGLWELVTTTSNFTHEFIGFPGVEYCFAIKAISEDGRFSFSNLECVTILASPSPSYSYIHTATVKEDRFVEIQYSFSANAKISKIELQRMKSDGTFETLEEIENPSQVTYFIDEDVDVYSKSYTYQVLYYDSCGLVGAPSNIGKTILTNVQTDDLDLLNYITWNPYEEFDGSVVGYHVFRGIDGIFDPTPITTVSPMQRSYVDDMNDWSFEGRVCYFIQAVEGSNLFNQPNYSVSNAPCAVVEPLIYVPNAFIPTGINNEFKPVITYFQVADYRMTIFDRWGQVIFQTTEYSEGWNGRFDNTKGETALGTYVYMIEVHDGEGNEIVKRGHVTLVR